MCLDDEPTQTLALRNKYLYISHLKAHHICQCNLATGDLTRD